jgi:CubicO group peptidase (beta-lactamase class C family)
MARGVALPRVERAATWSPRPDPQYWPTAGWRDSTPESQGLSSNILAQALLDAHAHNIAVHSVLVVRRGVVVLDATFYPFTPGSRHDVASVTKSVTSILIGAAVNAGRLSFTNRLAETIGSAPGRADERRSDITIENLLGMQSGFDCGFGRSERELSAMKESPNWIVYALQMPMRTEPGTEFGYCSPNYHLLSAVIQQASGITEEDYARQVLFGPLGISDVNWPRDPQGITRGWGELQLRPRDLAKLGFLYLHGGRWEERQIVSREWVARSTTPRVAYGERNLYGYAWWTNKDAPPGFFEAIGRGGQRLSVWPAKDLVVVMLGGGYEPGTVGATLVRALVSDSAIPPNPDGEARLRNAISVVASPPALLPMSRSPLENVVFGQTYRVGPNYLGLERFSITFYEGRDALATLELRDQTLVLPVGLDGRFRISDQQIDGIRPGARGAWRNSSQFVLEVDLIGKIDDYTMAMTFEGENINIELSERTGLVHQTLHGVREVAPR